MEKVIADEARETSLQKLLTTFEDAMKVAGGTFGDRESAALELANELTRRWLEAELGKMAARYGEHVRVNGELHRRHASGTRQYHTLCGTVEVRRDTYRRVGVHNGRTVVPLEIEAGLIEHATPALAFSVTQGFSERPLRHYEAEMSAAHRVVPSRSTLERIAKRIGTSLRETLPWIEPIVRASEQLPRGACSVSIGIDRTTVPMAERSEIAKKCRGRPYVRRPPEPVVVAYRMAYVGTLAVHDREGAVLWTRRFGSTAGEGPRGLLDRLGAEVRHVLRQQVTLPLVIVQDGAPELWNLVDEWLDREGLKAAMKMIDRFHVDERMAQLCELITCTKPQGRELFNTWRTQLDRSDSAIDRICRRLNALEHYQLFGGADREPMPAYWTQLTRDEIKGERASIAWGHVAYLNRYRRQLRYATARRSGFPIGSGVTEGACKSVITMRFKRSGQRWYEQGLSPCLQLRALHLNERLRSCFDVLLASRRGSFASA